VVLVVVRTINITRPFHEIAIFICPLILLPIIIYEAIQIGKLKPYESKIRYVFLPYVGGRSIVDVVIAAVNIKVRKGKKKSIQIPLS
jgi:hypothetical protein